MPPERVILATTTHREDVAQIVYGLGLRGIKASGEPDPERRGRFRVVLDSGDPEIAHGAMESIWDAVLGEIPRCVTAHGACLFCGYGVRALPAPVVCPECGRALDTIAARRAARDGKTPTPEQTHDPV